MNIEEGMENSSQMLLLDLFSGAGGAAMGYYRAGFEVIGVDHVPQPRYPFAFIQADALEVLRLLIDGQAVEDKNGRVWRLADFAVIHASPPCQKYSRLNQIHKSDYPDLVEPVRDLLKASGRSYVIENVERSPLVNPLKLCGSMFGLRVYRHRLFECNPPVWFAPQCNHWGMTAKKGQPKHEAEIMTVTGGFRVEPARQAMGIDWMSQKEISQAIPPKFTEYIGRQLIAALELTP